jgi:putative ABC transport system substrate-binding protein
LVRLNVDVIGTSGTPSNLAAKHATTTIPIVASAGDLLRLGLIASQARLGGNITGMTFLPGEGFSGK